VRKGDDSGRDGGGRGITAVVSIGTCLSERAREREGSQAGVGGAVGAVAECVSPLSHVAIYLQKNNPFLLSSLNFDKFRNSNLKFVEKFENRVTLVL
jgi:hypothetical protein